MVLVIGRGQCSADNRDALVALFEEMQGKSRPEEGCLRYGFFAAVEDPLSFVAVEEWADRDALDRHFAQPHLPEFAQPHLREVARGLLERVPGAPEVAIHEVVDTKPFPRGDAA